MMTVAFRVDGSIQIGAGHVMRCLTLADALKVNGVNCLFICRQTEGDFVEYIKKRGHSVFPLTRSPLKTEGETNKSSEYLEWLEVSAELDAQETIDRLKYISHIKIDWLIVDHYALDISWEVRLRSCCENLMVIDDLANRAHDCDVLLDQTFGRSEDDYKNLTPKGCTVFVGSQYALLRPEFARLRNQSLNRRENSKLKQLLITMGGVDRENVTCDILNALQNCDLPNDCRIVVVMGINAPWLTAVKRQAVGMKWKTNVRVNVSNMAQLMTDSDLCIGAAGSTAWERCCLGLPTILMVLAENQRQISGVLSAFNAVINLESLDVIIDELYGIERNLFTLSKNSSQITNGEGTKYIMQHIMSMS